MGTDTDIAATEVLAGLRAALDPDPERAGQKYAVLRRKLVSFFEWGGASAPEASADDTLMIAAWKMTDGEPAQSVSGGCAAIARAALHKQRQAQNLQPGTPDPASPSAEHDGSGDLDGILHAFETSLDALSEDSRDVLLTYYAGGHAEALEARRTLAQRLSLPLNQLRIRAHRTRTQLEQAVMPLAAPAAEPK